MMHRSIFFSILMLLATNVVFGQFDFEPAEVVFVAEEDDMLVVNVHVTNNTEINDPLYWKIELGDDFPEEWTIQICAGINCFAWDDLDCPPTAPYPIGIGETAPYKVTVRRNDFAPMNGTSHCVLKLYSDYEFTNEVGSSSLPITSITELNANDLVIYPNPAKHSFTINNDAHVSTLSIYNIVGREVSRLAHAQGMTHDVADLKMGIYLVRLMDNNGDTIKTMRLSKQ